VLRDVKAERESNVDKVSTRLLMMCPRLLPAPSLHPARAALICVLLLHGSGAFGFVCLFRAFNLSSGGGRNEIVGRSLEVVVHCYCGEAARGTRLEQERRTSLM